MNNAPIKLAPTRVWRTYTGGKLLDELHSITGPHDGHFPEEWIISAVKARNTGREMFSEEGLSFLENSDISLLSLIQKNSIDTLGEKHYKKFGAQTGVLVKIIDSAERLSIQVHPDKKTAKKLFNSDYGKTECWHILDCRMINNEKPCVYLGFKPGVTCERWVKLFNEQDTSGMLNSLHRFEVKKGDTFLIEGGVPHALGAGCFLIEIQEPTDYTIRTERITPAGFQISDFMCHQGLGFDTMFDCFHYDRYTAEEIRRKWYIPPKLMERTTSYTEYELIGYEDTEYFKMKFYEIYDECGIHNYDSFSGLYILSGKCTIYSGGIEQVADQGDQFFVPSVVSDCVIRNHGNKTVQVIQCFGPYTGT